jgi:predicted secreted protein
MEAVSTWVGELFRVRLEELPSSGHIWSCRDLPSTIRLVAVEPVGPVPLEIGAPSRKEFTFVATEAGDFVVAFVLQRPWESAPFQERRITVLVASERV